MADESHEAPEGSTRELQEATAIKTYIDSIASDMIDLEKLPKPRGKGDRVETKVTRQGSSHRQSVLIRELPEGSRATTVEVYFPNGIHIEATTQEALGEVNNGAPRLRDTRITVKDPTGKIEHGPEALEIAMKTLHARPNTPPAS